MKSETELREELKHLETQMGTIAARVKSVDAALTVNLLSPHAPGSVAAIKEYLTWLDGVEALGISYVNGNIVTQRLRLFYTRPDKKEIKDSDPYPRMREVKKLLEAVRHKDQSNLVVLRARRHAITAQLQKLEGNGGGREGRRSGSNGRILSVVWLQIMIVVIIVLVGGVLFESFKPEIIHFVRSTAGLQDTPLPPPAVGPADPGKPHAGQQRGP